MIRPPERRARVGASIIDVQSGRKNASFTGRSQKRPAGGQIGIVTTRGPEAHRLRQSRRVSMVLRVGAGRLHWLGLERPVSLAWLHL